jgi:hypothetical protein
MLLATTLAIAAGIATAPLPAARNAAASTLDSLVTERFVIFGSADQIARARADIDSAVSTFKRQFGEYAPRFAVLLANSPSEFVTFDLAAMRARGMRTLPFLVGGPAMSPLGEIHALGHESCHVMLLSWLDSQLGRTLPLVPQPGAQLMYGDRDAPDWLDEAVAVLCEPQSMRDGRRAQLPKAGGRIPLAQLLTMEHPVMPRMRAMRANDPGLNDGKPHVTISRTALLPDDAEAHTLGAFYAEALSLAEFLRATRGDAGFARVASALARGQTLPATVAAIDGKPTDFAALEAAWLQWERQR